MESLASCSLPLGIFKSEVVFCALFRIELRMPLKCKVPVFQLGFEFELRQFKCREVRLKYILSLKNVIK